MIGRAMTSSTFPRQKQTDLWGRNYHTMAEQSKLDEDVSGFTGAGVIKDLDLVTL